MFVWDESKRRKVIEDHRIDFALILDAFDDVFGVYFEDSEHSTDEEIRFNLIGFQRNTDWFTLHLLTKITMFV